MELSVDLNADLGEGAGHDLELLGLVSSANIACGVHAGSPAMMKASILAAQERGVAVGAHPGFDDRENFGAAKSRSAGKRSSRWWSIKLARFTRSLTR